MKHKVVGSYDGGYVVTENEIVAAAKELLAALERVGAGELSDSERELLELAQERPADQGLLVALAAEVSYRASQQRFRRMREDV